jgi:hypothetical protein
MPLPTDQHDWIQDAVIARAKVLGLTAYAIAQRTDGRVSADHVQAYLTRRKSMGSHKLQHVLWALGLQLVAMVELQCTAEEGDRVRGEDDGRDPIPLIGELAPLTLPAGTIFRLEGGSIVATLPGKDPPSPSP